MSGETLTLTLNIPAAESGLPINISSSLGEVQRSASIGIPEAKSQVAELAMALLAIAEASELLGEVQRSASIGIPEAKSQVAELEMALLAIAEVSELLNQALVEDNPLALLQLLSAVA